MEQNNIKKSDLEASENNSENIPVKIITDGIDADTEKEKTTISNEDNAESYLEQLKRLQAEFTNFKRRIDRERSDFAEAGRRGFVKSLLPVLDDFDHFFVNHADENNEVVAGVKLIKNKLMSTLESAGLEQFGRKGENFNPELHEAILVEESESELNNKIIEIWQPGYSFSGKLLRAAKVKVGRVSHQADGN